jgi:hypothetical protein
VGRHERHELALVGHVERVEPQDLAGAADGVVHGDGGLVEEDADAAVSAISLTALATPPRVGSRRTWRSGPRAARRRWTMSRREAESVSSVVSNSSPSRTLMMAMPWLAMGPLTRTASPGRARLGAISIPGGMRPTPVVLMKTPSPFPRSTTLVSPVTMRTPDSAAAACMERAMVQRSSMGKPSSRMNPVERARGVAPHMARSFTVPWTASEPMSPPGKK